MQITNTSFGDEQFGEGFRVFVDMNEQRFRSTFTPNHVIKLTETLYLSNTNIFVSNGSILGIPDPSIPLPGIVHINGERIIYYEKDGNRLGRIRRGVGGTGIAERHLAGSDVEDVGPLRYSNTGQYTPGPQYRVYPAALSVDEGNSIRFQIDTVNIEPGSTLYWTNDGSSQLVDFVGAGAGYTNNGSFQITGDYNAGTASVILTPAMDVSTEGNETIVFRVRTGSIVGPVVATSETVTINDISVIPEYNIVPRSSSIGEGSSVTYDVTTRGVAAGTTLYWTNSGSSQPADFTVQTSSGSLVLGGGYAGGFGTVKLDTVRSPGATATKSIILNLRSGSVSGTILKTANVVYITDTPDPAYSLSATITTTGVSAGNGMTLVVNENEQIKLDLFTTGVQGNITYFYNLTGNATSSDYGGFSSSGTMKTSGTEFGACANVIITLTEDELTEGIEVIRANVHATATFDAGSLVAGPVYINILDTSVAAAATITPSSPTISEGQSVTFSISTDGIRPGNLIYWRNLGTTTSGDFSNYPVGNSLVVSGGYRAGVASLTLTLSEDYTPNIEVDPMATEEGSETVVLAVYKNDPGQGSPAPLHTATVNITDTSKVTTTTTTTLSPTATPPPGAALVNFFNGDFEVESTPTTDGDGIIHIPGWSIYRPGVGTTPGHLRLNGFSNILGWPTPNDPTPSYGPTPAPYGDQDAPTSMEFSFSIMPDSAGNFGGAKVARLFSYGTSVPFGIVRGPYLVADNPIVCNQGDTVYFNWKAEGGGDDFDVFAYLLDTSNGNTVQLLDESSYSYGLKSTPWIRVEKVIGAGETGTYRFVFVCGSQDRSGGTVLGASLYLDNIDKISATPPPWSITVTPPTNKSGGSTFAFTWNAPAEAVGTTQGWFIVAPGTNTAFSGSGISAGYLGAPNNLSTSATSGVINIPTGEVSGAAENFQLLITSSDLNGTVLARSPICTIDPAAPSNVISPSCIANEVITRTITGASSGSSVWGSNPYTDDSDWSVAAVHAGLLTVGQTGTIKFTVLGVQNGGFTSTTANGITTTAWSTNWCAIQLSLP